MPMFKDFIPPKYTVSQQANPRKQSYFNLPSPSRGLWDCLQTVPQHASAAATTAALLFPHFFATTTRKYFRSFTLRCYARITVWSVPFVGVFTAESIPRATNSKPHDNYCYLYISRQKHFSTYFGRLTAFSSQWARFYLLMGQQVEATSSHHRSPDGPSHTSQTN